MRLTASESRVPASRLAGSRRQVHLRSQGAVEVPVLDSLLTLLSFLCLLGFRWISLPLPILVPLWFLGRLLACQFLSERVSGKVKIKAQAQVETRFFNVEPLAAGPTNTHHPIAPSPAAHTRTASYKSRPQIATQIPPSSSSRPASTFAKFSSPPRSGGIPSLKPLSRTLNSRLMAWDVREHHPGAGATALVASEEPYVGTQRHFRLVNSRMSVRVSVRFAAPIHVEFSRRYDSSRTFEATPELCDTLLRRLQHCSEELISRRDPQALEPAVDRLPRYEIKYELINAPCSTKERSFWSYQKALPTMEQAGDVIVATDRIIGLFFLRHDEHFEWVSSPIKEYAPTQPRAAIVSAPASDALSCVPNGTFQENTQTYEFVPGYELELAFTSTCPTRDVHQFAKTIRISSHQSSPLNLCLAEEMLSAASKVLEIGLDTRRRAVKGFRWPSLDEDAVSVSVHIKNNIGPDHDHLDYRIRSKQVLFSQPAGEDCLKFLEALEDSLCRVRNMTDDAIGQANELEVRVLELRAPRWYAFDPLAISLDSTVTYSRRTIGAILDRVQTSVTGVLHGNDLSLTLSIFHRGHLILDKIFVASDTSESQKRPLLAMTPEQEGNVVLSKLRDRIHSDIILLCKDTCSLGDETEGIPNLHIMQKGHALPHRPSVQEVSLEASRKPQPHQAFCTPPPSDKASPVMSKAAVATRAPSLRRDASTYSDSLYKQRYPAVVDAEDEDHDDKQDEVDMTPPSTPSLIYGESETPRDSILITPSELRRSDTIGVLTGRVLRIADEDGNDTMGRDFSSFEEHAETGSKPYQFERVSMTKFGGCLVVDQGIPESPTPVRTVDITLDSEGEQDAASVSDSVSEVSAEDSEARADDPEPLPVPEVMTHISDEMAEEETQAEPIMEGWLEYCCEPIEPVEPTPEDSTDDQEVQPEPIMEGWLEYCCEPLEPEEVPEEISIEAISSTALPEEDPTERTMSSHQDEQVSPPPRDEAFVSIVEELQSLISAALSDGASHAACQTSTSPRAGGLILRLLSNEAGSSIDLSDDEDNISAIIQAVEEDSSPVELPAVVPVELPAHVPEQWFVDEVGTDPVEVAACAASEGPAEIAPEIVLDAPTLADAEAELGLDDHPPEAKDRDEAVDVAPETSADGLAAIPDFETSSSVETLVELVDKDIKAIKNQASADTIVAIIETSDGEHPAKDKGDGEVDGALEVDQDKPVDAGIETLRGNEVIDPMGATEEAPESDLTVAEDAEVVAPVVDDKIAFEEADSGPRTGDGLMPNLGPFPCPPSDGDIAAAEGWVILSPIEGGRTRPDVGVSAEMPEDTPQYAGIEMITVDEESIPNSLRVKKSGSVASGRISLDDDIDERTPLLICDVPPTITQPIGTGLATTGYADEVAAQPHEGKDEAARAVLAPPEPEPLELADDNKDEPLEQDDASWYLVHYDSTIVRSDEPKGKEAELPHALPDAGLSVTALAGSAKEAAVAALPSSQELPMSAEPPPAYSPPKVDVPELPASRFNSAVVLRPASSIFNLCPILGGSAAVVDDRPVTAVPFSRPQHKRAQSVGTTGLLGLHDDYKMPLQTALLGARMQRSASAFATPSPTVRPVTVHGLPDPPKRKISHDVEHGESGDEESGARPARRGFNAFPGFVIFAAGVTLASSIFRRAP